MATEKEINERWDMHSGRQVEASKSGAVAVTLLNSGSWLALLSQVGSLKAYTVGWPILAWGSGALLGTSLWLFIYRGALLSQMHDFDRENKETERKLNNNIRIGVTVAILSLVCFALGVVTLAGAFL